MSKPAVEKNLDFQTKAQNHKFRSIQELAQGESEKKEDPVIQISPEQVASWMGKRPGAKAGITVKIKLGYPDVCELPIVFAAVVQFEDRVEVLNVDGKTHCFALGEVIL